jgi:hypothetical protein
MRRLTGILAALGLLAFLASGCGREGGPAAGGNVATDEFARIDLDKGFGGLTATAEEPAFADPGMEAALAADAGEVCLDPLVLTPEFQRLDRALRGHPDLPDSLRPGLTFLRVRWGHLAGPVDTLDAAGDCARTDWSGTIRVDRGLLVVRRVLAFERPDDHIVFPRVDAHTVGVASATRCGHDGIVLQILTLPAALEDSATAAVPNRLHFELGPFSATYDVADLVAITDLVEIDADGNNVELTGVHPRRPDACPSGTLVGRYRKAAADLPDTAAGDGHDRLGRLMVAWRSSDGGLGGFLRGAYGLNDAGARVFVGKLIGPRGEFRGLVQGTWETGVAAGDLLHFSGQWFGAGGSAEGVVAGDGYPGPDGGGGFVTGRWSTLCDGQVADTVR